MLRGPELAPRWARRTSTVDVLWPDGPAGGLFFRGRARDVRLSSQGTLLDPVEAVALDVTTTAPGDITALETDDEALDASLVGARLGPGFRKLARQALPEHRGPGSLTYLLLDELPVMIMITGYARRRAQTVPPDEPVPASARVFRADVCSGWRSGGAIALAIADTGQAPLSPPVTAPLESSDPAEWHAVDPLPPASMRRRRRLTVADSGVLEIEARFRDTYAEPDGTETTVHEYTVSARADPDSLELTEITVTPGTLPSLDCPLAAPSGVRTVGVRLARLREHVKDSMHGPTTCTHLNDVLRSLADAASLSRGLARFE